MSKDYDIKLEVGLETREAVEQMDKLVSDLSGKTVNVKVEGNGVEVGEGIAKSMKGANAATVTTQKSLDRYLKTVTKVTNKTKKDKKTGKDITTTTTSTSESLNLKAYKDDVVKEYKDTTNKLLGLHSERERALSSGASDDYIKTIENQIEATKKQQETIKANNKEMLNNIKAKKKHYSLSDKDIKDIEKSFDNAFTNIDAKAEESKVFSSSKLISDKKIKDTKNELESLKKIADNTVKDYDDKTKDLVKTTADYEKAKASGASSKDLKAYEDRIESINKEREAIKAKNEATLEEIETNKKRFNVNDNEFDDYKNRNNQSFKDIDDEATFDLSIKKNKAISDVEAKETQNQLNSLKDKANKLVKEYQQTTNDIVKAEKDYEKAKINNASPEELNIHKDRIESLNNEKKAIEASKDATLDYIEANKKALNISDDASKSLKESYNKDFSRIDDKAIHDINVNKANLASKVVPDSDMKGASDQIAQYKKLLKEKNSLEKNVLNTKDITSKQSKNNILSNLKAQVEEARNGLSEKQKLDLKLFDEQQLRGMEKAYADYGAKLGTSISSIGKEMQSLGKNSGLSEGLTSEINEVLSKVDELSAKQLDLSPDSSISEIKALGAEVDNLKLRAEDIKIKIKEDEEVKGQINKIATDLETQLSKIQVELGDFLPSSEVQKFKQEIQGVRTSSNSLKEAEAKAAKLRDTMNGAAQNAKNIKTQFSNLKIPFFTDLNNSLKTFGMGYMVTNSIRTSLNGSLKTIKEMDAAMVEMAKVAKGFSGTDSEKAEIRKMALEISTEVARSSEQIISGMSSAFRSGLANNIEEALQISKKSSILANVSDVSQEVADEFITSIINSFGKREVVLDEFKIKIPEDAVEGSYDGLQSNIARYTEKYGESYTELDNLMDLINYAGNNFAITNEGVGEAMARSAAMLNEHGVAIEEAVAIIAAGNESLQNPEKLGNAAKTIASRLSGIGYSTKEGRAEINKTGKALKDLAGIDIFKDKQKGQIKDMYQIFEELAEVWDTLNDEDKFALGEAIAGKQQANVLSAIMGNWERAKQLRDDYLNGETVGSSMRENERYIESIEGALVRLTENMKRILFSVISPDQFRELASFGADFVENIAESFSRLSESGKLMLPLISGLMGLKGLAKSLGTDSVGIFGAFGKNLIGNILQDTTKATAGMTGLANTTKGLAGGFKVANIGALALKGTLGLLSGVITGVTIALAGMAIKKYIDHQNRYTDAIEKSIEKIQQLEEKEDEYSKTLNEIENVLPTYITEYDKLSGKKNKTTEDLERMKVLLEEIEKISPDLIEFDADGNAIRIKTEEIEALTQKYKELLEQQQAYIRNEKISAGQSAKKEYDKNNPDKKWGVKVNKTRTNKNSYKAETLGNHDQMLANPDGVNKAKNAKETIEEIEGYYARAEGNNERLKSIYQKNIKETEDYYTQLGTHREGLIASYENDTDLLEGLSTEQKNLATKNAKDLYNSFEMLHMEDSDIHTLSGAIKEITSSGEKLPESLQEFIKAKKEFETTKDISKYLETVDKLKPSLASALGVSEEVIDSATSIHESYIKNSDSLDLWLRKLGKNKNGTDEATKSLTDQYNATVELGNYLSNESNWNNGIFNKDILANIKKYLKDLPPVFKDTMDALTKDGEFSYQDATVLTNIDYIYKNPEKAEQYIPIVQKQLDELLGDESFSVKAKFKVEGIYDGHVTLEELETLLPDDVTVDMVVNGTAEVSPELKKAIVDSLVFDLEVNGTANFSPELLASLMKCLSLEEIEELLPKKETIDMVINGTSTVSDELKTAIINSLSKEEIEALLPEGLTIDMVTKGNFTVDGKEITLDEQLIARIKELVEGTEVKAEVGANVEAKDGSKKTTEKTTIENKVTNEETNKVVNETKNEVKNETTNETKNETTNKVENKETNETTNKTENVTKNETTNKVENQEKNIVTKSDGSETTVNNQIEGAVSNKGTKYISVLQDPVNNAAAVNRAIDATLKNKTVYVNVVKRESGGASTSGGDAVSILDNTQPPAYDGGMDVPSPVATVSDVAPIDTPATTPTTTPTTTPEAPVVEATNPKARASKSSSSSKVLTGNTEYLKYGIELQTTLLNSIQKLNNELDLLDTKLEHAYGKEKIDLLKQQVELTKALQKEQGKLIDKYKAEQAQLKTVLSKQGFKFDSDGNITNYVDLLKKLEKNADGSKSESTKKKLEEVKKALDKYLDLTFDEIPNAIEEWESLGNSIKDAYKEQLEVTKDMEDKITDIYKKQVDERKELIDKELDKRLKALDQQRKAYNEAREEEDYQRELNKQQDVMAELQEKIALASRDTSSAGRAKLKELMKEYQEQQEVLEELIRDNTDKQINDMFDKQEELLQEKAEKEKEKLDEKYSDENLKDIVQEALKTGQFIDIDGNMKDLQDALIEFEDKFGDGMTAMGQIVKNELVTNLDIAKNTIKDMTSVLEKLDLPKLFETAKEGIKGLNMLGIDSSILTPKSISMADVASMTRGISQSASSSPVINFNQPLIAVEGSVTKDTLPELNSLIKEVERRITNNIVNALR